MSVHITQRQLKVRSFTDDMEYVASRLRKIVIDHHPWLLRDPTIDMVSQTNSLSPLIYCNKYQELKRKQQMPLHTDIEYQQTRTKVNANRRTSSKNIWVPTENNSQKVATPTIALSLLDERTIHLTEQKPGNKAKQVSQPYDVEWILKHGTIVFLHPWDEKPKSNTKKYLTQWKHRNIWCGGDNKMSMCLAFQTTCSK